MSCEFRPGEDHLLSLYLGMAAAARRDRGGASGAQFVIAIRGTSDGNTHLALLAITSQPPQAGRSALEIPDIERKRAGLGDLKQSWIMVDEYNYAIVERSWYIEPDQEILGRFSKSFMVKIAGLFTEARGRSGRVNRLD